MKNNRKNTISDSKDNTKIVKGEWYRTRDKKGRFISNRKATIISKYATIQWEEETFVDGPNHKLNNLFIPEESTRTELYKQHFYAFAYE